MFRLQKNNIRSHKQNSVALSPDKKQIFYIRKISQLGVLRVQAGRPHNEGSEGQTRVAKLGKLHPVGLPWKQGIILFLCLNNCAVHDGMSWPSLWRPTHQRTRWCKNELRPLRRLASLQENEEFRFSW